MILVYPNINNAGFDHLVKVKADISLHCKIIDFPFVTEK